MCTNNKLLLFEAIDNYDIYVESKRRTLKALVNIAVNNIAKITPTALIRLLNVSRPIIYYNIKHLEEDNIIKIEKPSIYRLDEAKLKEIVTIYKNKQSVI